MNLLVVGGSGYVGTMILPHLARHHTIRVLDPVAPPPGPWEHLAGNAEDKETVAAGLRDVDALLYMAMNTQNNWGSVPTVLNAFDVNVKALYMSLWAACDAGIAHCVYLSSLSVYRERAGRYPVDATPPDATDFYGLTKRFGEEVCRAWVSDRGITVTALRLCFPIADDAPAPTTPRFKATTFTRAHDVARAVSAALAVRDGFQAVTVSGDVDECTTPLARAREVLGWAPTRAAHGSAEPTGG